MEDIAALEVDIKHKIENAFDARHIYEIFSTLISSIRYQQDQITHLRSDLQNANKKVAELAANVHTMEYNIQGFDSDDDDFLDSDDTPVPIKRSASRRTPRVRDRKGISRRESKPQPIEESDATPSTPTAGENSSVNESTTHLDSIPKEADETPVIVEESTPAEFTPTNVEAASVKGTDSPPLQTNADTTPAHDSEPEESTANALPEGNTAEPQVNDIVTPPPDIEKSDPEKKDEVSATDNPGADVHPSAEEATVAAPASPQQPSQQENVNPDAEHLSSGKLRPHYLRTEEEERAWKAKKRRVLRLVMEKVRTMMKLSRSHLSVARSKLDPKLSVNNRIRALEDNLSGLTTLVNAHRKALDAVPARIRAVIPPDLKTQLARLSVVMDNMESLRNKLSASAPAELTTHESQTESAITGALVPDADGQFPDSFIQAIVKQVLEKMPRQTMSSTPRVMQQEVEKVLQAKSSQSFSSQSVGNQSFGSQVLPTPKSARSAVVDTEKSEKSEAPEKVVETEFRETQARIDMNTLLSDDTVEKIAQKMIEAGHLDELRQPVKSRRASAAKAFFRPPSAALSSPTRASPVATPVIEDEDEDEAFIREQTAAVVKDLTKNMVTREDISLMLDVPVGDSIGGEISGKVQEYNISSSGPGTPTLSAPPGSIATRDTTSAGSAPGEEALSFPEYRARGSDQRRDSAPASLNFRGRRGSASQQQSSLQFADRFRSVIAQQIQQLTSDSVKHSELDEKLKQMQTYINLEINKAVSGLRNDLKELGEYARERNIALQSAMQETNATVSNLDFMLKTQLSEVNRQQQMADNADRSWRPEILKIQKQIQAKAAEQTEVARALLVDLERLQKEVQERVDEKRLEELVGEINKRIQRGVEEGVDPVNNSIASIVRAVKHKADKHEMERMLAERIAQTEDAIARLEAETEAAGVTKCLSCGQLGPNAAQSEQSLESFHSSISSWAGNKGGDYEQVLAVIHRNAGLKPLTRHGKPMAPKISSRPHTSDPSGAPAPLHRKDPRFPAEPLYRRAKHVNQMKEVPKVPLVNFGHSTSSPEDIYHLDTSTNSRSSQAVGGVGGVKFPRVPAPISAPKNFMSQSQGL